MSSNAIAIAAIAAIGAEATGVTNFSGGKTTPQVPTGGMDPGTVAEIAQLAAKSNQAEVPTPAPTVIETGSGGGSGGNEAMAKAIAELAKGQSAVDRAKEKAQEVKDAAEDAKEKATDTAQDVKDKATGGNESTRSGNSSEPVVRDAGSDPTTPGGKVAKNASQAVWHGGAKPLAVALNDNTALEGDFQDNLNDLGNSVTGPIDVKNTYVEETKKSADQLKEGVEQVGDQLGNPLGGGSLL